MRNLTIFILVLLLSLSWLWFWTITSNPRRARATESAPSAKDTVVVWADDLLGSPDEAYYYALRDLWNTTHPDVHMELASDLPKVLADPEAIKRAVANLVDNAAEAMQESLVREIHIATSVLDGREAVELVVADTGHGVTTELKEKLFLPYFSTKKRGTGLGLAIVSRIIEDHHGSIRVEENFPVGARFIVEVPLASQQQPESITSHPSHA